MHKIVKEMANVAREFNGVMARYSKDQSEENLSLLEDVTSRLKEKVDKYIDGKN